MDFLIFLELYRSDAFKQLEDEYKRLVKEHFGWETPPRDSFQRWSLEYLSSSSDQKIDPIIPSSYPHEIENQLSVSLPIKRPGNRFVIEDVKKLLEYSNFDQKYSHLYLSPLLSEIEIKEELIKIFKPDIKSICKKLERLGKKLSILPPDFKYNEFLIPPETNRELFNKIQNVIGKADKTKALQLFTLLSIRYKYMNINNQGLSIPLSVWKDLVELGVSFEGFSNFYNSTLPNFGTPFSDLEYELGGKSNFFDTTFSNAVVEVNPPFVESVINKTISKIHVECLLPQSYVCFICFFPLWEDIKYENGCLIYQKDLYKFPFVDYSKEGGRVTPQNTKVVVYASPTFAAVNADFTGMLDKKLSKYSSEKKEGSKTFKPWYVKK